MSAASAIAPDRQPETRSTPGLSHFLARQRAVTVPAGASDQPAAQTPGQSETAAGSDQAKAPETGKTDKKQKTAEELQVELSNQAKANLRLGAERADLQRTLEAMKKELAELKAKAEGTYVEPSQEQKEREAVLKAEFEKFEQRKEASKHDAVKEFGEAYVLDTIYQDDAPFATITKEKPWLVQRVMSAERPVHEAIAVVNEEAVLTKFGRTEAEVLKKATELLRPVLFEQFKTELAQPDGGVKPSPTVPSLNRVRTAGSDPKLSGTEQVRTFSALNINPHNRV